MKKFLFSVPLLFFINSTNAQEYEEYAQAPVNDYGAREEYPSPEERPVRDDRMEEPRDYGSPRDSYNDERSAYSDPAPADNYRDDYREDYPQDSYPADDRGRAEIEPPPMEVEPSRMDEGGYDDYDY